MGIRAYEKALYLDELTDDAIAVLVDRAVDKTSPMSFAGIVRLDGAYCRVRDEDTAYGCPRRPQYAVSIAAVSPDAQPLAADRAWVRSLWDALRPLAGEARDQPRSTDLRKRSAKTATARHGPDVAATAAVASGS